MNHIDHITGQWLDRLTAASARAGTTPAGPGGTDKMNNEPTLASNNLGENWTDAVRAYGRRYGNTADQITQQIDRAKGLVVCGHSVASAVETVRRTLERWSQIRGDDTTFQQRKAALRRGARFWRVPA